MSAIHDAEHDRIARVVRAQAYANAATRCRRCGLTLAERRLTHPRATWDAGHPDPGQTGYAPECSSCNRSAGAAKGNRQRNGVPTTQAW